MATTATMAAQFCFNGLRESFDIDDVTQEDLVDFFGLDPAKKIWLRPEGSEGKFNFDNKSKISPGLKFPIEWSHLATGRVVGPSWCLHYLIFNIIIKI